MGHEMANDFSSKDPHAPAVSTPTEIDAFLKHVRGLDRPHPSGARGRLIFALDATASREPTWDLACQLQADMFAEAAKVGGLDIQLVYYRGFSECRASRFTTSPRELAAMMESIQCKTGYTQIGKVLAHARRETAARKVQALVFVGDAMEESVDDLCAEAGELGRRGVPVFMFQEGDDPEVKKVYREITRLSRGAYCRFDPDAAHQLGELLRAVAAYASGGLSALGRLAANKDGPAVRLLEQLK